MSIFFVTGCSIFPIEMDALDLKVSTTYENKFSSLSKNASDISTRYTLFDIVFKARNLVLTKPIQNEY